MGAGAPTAGAVLLGQREQARPGRLLELHRIGEGAALARADLDLRLDQLARHRLGQDLVLLRRGGQLPVALGQRQGGRVEDPELLLEATVKSSEASKTSRALAMSSIEV